jgi:serine/threonine protein kinase
MWKIADFGMTMEGSSVRPTITTYRRGTDGYRAPEILNQRPEFTQNVDLWAVGCILYEVVTRENLFRTDNDIINYCATRDLEMPIFPFSKKSNFYLLEIIRKLISINPQRRGSAKSLADWSARFPIKGQSEDSDEVSAAWALDNDEELQAIRGIALGCCAIVFEVQTLVTQMNLITDAKHVHMEGIISIFSISDPLTI